MATVSGFSEYTVCSEIHISKFDQSAELEKACLISCCIGTGYGAAVNTGNVQPGSTCAVWGVGAVGMACILGCKHAGASKIIAVDINSDKESKAKAVGATDFMNPKDYDKPIQQVLQEMTGGGCDYTFECAGTIPTGLAALEASHPSWGRSVVVGMAPQDQKLSFSPLQVMYGRTLTGCMFGGYKPRQGMSLLGDQYMAGKLPLDEFITHTMPLDKINDAFHLLLSGKSIRTVIVM